MVFRIYIVIWFAVTVDKSQSSLVIDSYSQNTVYIGDYCPKMKFCPEGAHVMCMYYNPNRVMGQHCVNPKNVTMTPQLANKLLDVANAIRSKMALGKEKGEGGARLPRGYGMFRLKWDNELATFAQVLANQCILRHDLCRATKRFPDPGQNTGLVRFSFPEWFPPSQPDHFRTPGLSVAKLDYAVTRTLKSWYGMKDAVAPTMLYSYPDWTLNPSQQVARLYLQMIYGPATHMGCGISAYTEYAYHNNNADLHYNSVQLICNFSARPRTGGPVYNTEPPDKGTGSNQCGCPEGTEEDADCLCREIEKPAYSQKCSGANCQTPIVLLPIFTVEDASHHTLDSFQPSYNHNTTVTRTKEDSMEIFKDYESKVPTKREGTKVVSPSPTKQQDQEDVKDQKQVASLSPDIIFGDLNRPQPSRTEESFSPRNDNAYQKIQVRKRYFDNRKVNPKPRFSVISPTPSFTHARHSMFQRESIFSRAPKFELPNIKKKETEITDPVPVHSFGNIEKLMQFISNKTTTIAPTTNATMAPEKENYYTPEFNKTLKSFKNFRLRSSNEESDKRLMALLDNLEKEVKHIDLDVNEKQLFDEKIRKIYGTVVGKRDDFSLKPQGNIVPAETVPPPLVQVPVSKRISLDKMEELSQKAFSRSGYETDDEMKEIKRLIYGKLSDDETLKRPLKNRKVPEEESEKHNLYGINDLEGLNQRVAAVSDLKNKFLYAPDENIEVSNNRRSIYNLNEMEDDLKNPKYSTYNRDEINDPLGVERRKYYQEKLDNLERRMHNINYRRREDRRTRPLLPCTKEQAPPRHRTPKTENSHFYIPDRAKFVHGF